MEDAAEGGMGDGMGVVQGSNEDIVDEAQGGMGGGNKDMVEDEADEDPDLLDTEEGAEGDECRDAKCADLRLSNHRARGVQSADGAEVFWRRWRAQPGADRGRAV